MKKNFEINEIVNEKFNQELNGYSPSQVDNFLDLIVEDYQSFAREINEFQKTIDDLEEIITIQREAMNKNQLQMEMLKSRLAKYTKVSD